MKYDSPRILVSFYLGSTTDSAGRDIDSIQAWNYDKLESVHDYIQWLFPLKERSTFNPGAPILDADQIAAFRSSDELKSRLLKSFRVMLGFFGLSCEESAGTIKIVKSKEYAQRKDNWLSIGNHNYLRITRILVSLRVLGLRQYSSAFLEFLERLYEEEGPRIGSTTLGYWRRAILPGEPN